MNLVFLNPWPSLIWSNKILNFVFAIPVNIMIFTEFCVHDIRFLIIYHNFFKTPNQLIRTVANWIYAWDIGKTAAIYDIKYKSNVILAGMGVCDGKSLMGVGSKYLAICQLD